MVEVIEIIDAPEEGSDSDNESASMVSGGCSNEENWQVETKRVLREEYDQLDTPTKTGELQSFETSPTPQRNSEETIDELMDFFTKNQI